MMNEELVRKNTVIFVTGGPGTGKSFASEFLRTHIKGLTLLSYDRLKELAWDRFGFDDEEEKQQIDRLSLEEFYLVLQRLMREKKTILTEYPFYQRHSGKLKEIVKKNHYHAITILLYGDWKTIYERGKKRDSCSTRHPGHLTNHYRPSECRVSGETQEDAVLSYEEFRSVIDRKDYDIRIGTTIKVDVTDLSQIDYDQLLKQIHKIDEQNAE